MIEYTRDDVIEALEYLLSPVCTETQFDYCDEIRAAIAFLKEQETRVLEYSEIAEHPLVWFEDVYIQDVIPALFTQYDGCGAHFAIQVRDKYNDSIVRSTIFIHSETIYGKIWRCWSARPTEEQMRETKWEGENDA